MRNFIQPGVNLTLANPYDAAVASGDGVLIGNIFGVSAGAAAALGDSVDLVTEGVFTMTKGETDEYEVGSLVYWDDAEREIVPDSDDGANLAIGVAVTAAANPSASVNVKLTPTMFAIVPELPSFTAPDDNDKVLTIVAGEVAWAAIPGD